LLLNKDVIAIE